MVARLYAEGTDRVEEVEVVAGSTHIDDRSILWVDVPAQELAGVEEALLINAPSHGSTPSAAVAIRAQDIRLNVTALRGTDGPAEGVELRFVLARNIVITVHDHPIRGLADPIAVVAEDPRFGRLDAGRFAGLLIDGVLHGYDDAIEDLDQEIDRLDERALRDEPQDELEAIVDLRRRIADLRRWLAPQRAALAALTRPIEDEPSPIGQPDAELLAHLGRTIESIEQTRERLLGTFDILMARTGQRTNDVMRILTVVSAVLLPSVVIAGIMGMNYPAPIFDEPSLFYVVVAAMVVIAVATLAVARWRRWI